MSKISSHACRWLAVGLAGPMLEGAILGLREGARAMAALALGLPLIVAGVTALTTPTLYVGGAVFRGRLSLVEVGVATGRALHALGLALLGVAPLSLLLAATLPVAQVAPAQVGVLVVVALAVSLHRLAGELRTQAGDHPPLAGVLLFGAYATVAVILGGRLFFDLVSFSQRVAS
jgi:hypothetical protein